MPPPPPLPPLQLQLPSPDSSAPALAPTRSLLLTPSSPSLCCRPAAVSGLEGGEAEPLTEVPLGSMGNVEINAQTGRWEMRDEWAVAVDQVPPCGQLLSLLVCLLPILCCL